MGAKSARKHNRNQALRAVNTIQYILNRINRKYAPVWMLKALDSASIDSQCILHEAEMVMKEFGDEELQSS